ncbi:MAG: protein translocase subunit SecF [Alphaproteobacteria bacterium GM7ARS4]|nr:protein translocase subunit SecF [Alphaproteobacteria bacterium GM7ARS4]
MTIFFSHWLRQKPTWRFMRFHRHGLIGSASLVVLSLLLFSVVGLDYGIDFRGGMLMEVSYNEPPDVGEVRDSLRVLELGDVQIQTFGKDTILLIRVQRQQGDEKAQMAVITQIKERLGKDLDYRRVEFVGPRVGQELVESGIYAVLFSLLAILLYVWMRFDGWHFALASVVALLHDVLVTIGLFSALQLEFNLSTVAAVLTIAGYSINDTVVVFDRMREMMRRHRSSPFHEIIDMSINATLSRTVMTSVTTALALFALLLFGGSVLHDFVLAMLWGVFVGTWSSIFVAGPMMLLLKFDMQEALRT